MTREEKNTLWSARGAYACPLCGDSHGWKEFHETVYFEGRMTDATGMTWMGSEALSALCVDCWPKLTPEERLPHYLARMEARKLGIPSIAKLPVAGVGLVDDEADRQRFEADVAKIDATIKALTEAVLAGK